MLHRRTTEFHTPTDTCITIRYVKCVTLLAYNYRSYADLGGTINYFRMGKARKAFNAFFGQNLGNKISAFH
jgi:hypothetical protein